MSITTETKKLKSIVKESVKEALASEMMKLRADLLPLVASKEQKEIEKTYGKPKRKAVKSISIKA